MFRGKDKDSFSLFDCIKKDEKKINYEYSQIRQLMLIKIEYFIMCLLTFHLANETFQIPCTITVCVHYNDAKACPFVPIFVPIHSLDTPTGYNDN